MLTPEQITELAQILSSLNPPDELQQIDLADLLMRGAVVSLEEDASEGAIRLLSTVVTQAPIPAIRRMALASIERLAQNKNEASCGALYELALDRDLPEACEIITKHHITVDRIRDIVFFTFLFGSFDEYLTIDPDYHQLTRAYLDETQNSVRERLLKAADRHGFENWAWIILALQDPNNENLSDLISRFGSLTDTERSLAIEGLQEMAAEGNSEAKNALSEICIQYENKQACQITLNSGYHPTDPVRQALFFFLMEQWDDYERVDFSHNLLNTAFETAGTNLRQRMLAHSRFTGQVEWLSASEGRRLRWLKDLSDADWHSTIQQLRSANREDALWRLAQSAPPIWSSTILSQMDRPEKFTLDEQEAWNQLAELARKAQSAPLQMKSKKSLRTSGLINALAASPDGHYLAAGGPEPQIQLWKFPHGQWLSPLSGPVAQTRSLDFSPNSETIACASGDHALRVFRLADGQLVKTLTGHTGLIRSLVVHPDGRTAFSASFDGTLRAWRYPLGPELRKFEMDGGELFGLALSESGRAILTAGADRKVHVLRWPEGQEVRQLSGANDVITNLAAASTGQLVAAYSRDRSIRIWNHTSGRLIQQMNLSHVPVTALIMHPDQNLLFCGQYDGVITIWDISTGQTLAEIPGHMSPVTGFALLSNEDTLISSAGNEILLWDLETFLLIRRPVESAQPELINQIQSQLERSGLSLSVKNWLEFTVALLRWKARFDIEIGGPKVVELGEFDIQL